MSCNPHLFGGKFKRYPEPGEICGICGIIFCPVAYDHNPQYGYCAVCGWDAGDIEDDDYEYG